MIVIKYELQPAHLQTKIDRLWSLSAIKLRSLERSYDPAQGSPVFTVSGRYTAQKWTEWTQGFQFGSTLLQFDGTGDEEFLDFGRINTAQRMSPHLTDSGVHDHGFNNVSTYGHLLRLMNEGKLKQDPWEKNFYELALKCSGAVQASRWTDLVDQGYIYSFNGPHSLFADTMRSLRSLALAHQLGQKLFAEGGREISLLKRLIQHARTTARYNVYYGKGRDIFDTRGRVAHESIFNLNDKSYRCPSTQQGFSPFTTWTRGLAWVMCGFAEQLEFLETLNSQTLECLGGQEPIESFMLQAALASSDYYIQSSPSNGIPYWDTGAPLLSKLGNDILDQPAQPRNKFEPVDSSAAAIAAQGLLRLGQHLERKGKVKESRRYWHAGLTVLETLFGDDYMSLDPKHQGLILHSLYHRPRGWDHVTLGKEVPSNESTLWGDYHAREAALYIQRMARGEPYLTFWNSGRS